MKTFFETPQRGKSAEEERGSLYPSADGGFGLLTPFRFRRPLPPR